MPSQLTLPDGRTLDYHVWGASSGFPLLFSHGNPGSWIAPPHVVKACESNGFTLVTWSRPGFGGSTRRRGRSVLDDTDNVRALLKHLGYSRFASMGWSAGGPHVLASAAKVDGCVAAVVISGLGPSDVEGLVWSAGTSKGKSEEELQQKYASQRTPMITATAAELIADVKPESDKRALLDIPGLAQYVEDSFREALKISMDGMVDDDLSFFKPWGFNVADIEVPVFLYYGTADPSIHISHAEWIASHMNPRYMTKHFEIGGGHVSGIRNMQDMLDEIKASM